MPTLRYLNFMKPKTRLKKLRDGPTIEVDMQIYRWREMRKKKELEALQASGKKPISKKKLTKEQLLAKKFF